MRNGNDDRTGLILALCGIIPVVWLALLTAPYVGGGIVEIVGNLSVAMGDPFSITVMIFWIWASSYSLSVCLLSLTAS